MKMYKTDNSHVPAGQAVVYMAVIGNHVKIGFTTHLKARLRSFLNSAATVDLLLAVPGDRALERRLHQVFSSLRITRELFRYDGWLQGFVDNVAYGGLDRGFRYIEETSPKWMAEKRREGRAERTRVERQKKAEIDAHCASLVADRVKRLGW